MAIVEQLCSERTDDKIWYNPSHDNIEHEMNDRRARKRARGPQGQVQSTFMRTELKQMKVLSL